MLKTRKSTKHALVIVIFAGIIYMLPLQYFLLSPSLGSFYSMIVADGGVRVERGINYGSHARHKLDIYHSAEGDTDGPIVLFIYGGSWREGDRAIYGFLGAALAKQGITTIIPDYRLFPDVMFPIFNQDAAKAYLWSYHNVATQNSAKARPIILMGHSAGAHIAALLTTDQHYLAASGANIALPAGYIGLAGPLTFDPTTDLTTKEVFANVSIPDKARPVSFVRPGLPPTLLFHGLEDTTVKMKNTREFTNALLKSGNDVCKLELPNIGHVGLILAFSRPLRWRAPVLKESVKFIHSLHNGQKDSSVLECGNSRKSP